MRVLLAPLVGETTNDDLEQSLTDALRGVLKARTDRRVKIRKGNRDTVAITGCAAKSEECFDAMTNVIGVEWMIFGTIEKAKKGAIPVHLTLVDASERRYETRRVLLRSTAESRRDEFEVKARAFIDGQPDPDSSIPEKPWLPRRELNLARVSNTSWGVVGGGAAALTTGFILLGVGSGKQDQVNAAPVANVADLEHLVALERSGQRYTTMGNALIVLGSVTTVVGVSFVVYQGYFKNKKPEKPEKPPVNVTIAPGAGSGRGLSVFLGGRF